MSPQSVRAQMQTDMEERARSPFLCRNEGRDTRTGRYLLQKELDFIHPFLERMARPGILLDLCCGSGPVTLLLRNSGVQVVGLDANWGALARFRQRSQDVPLVQGDALCLPLAGSSLGCIVAIHCFDHLDRIRFLQECGRVLGNGGLLIFDSLNRHSYKLALKRIRRRTSIKSSLGSGDKWIDVFSWSEVMQAITGAGFDVEEMRGYGWIPFDVNSDSKLVNAAAWVEQVLRLDLFPSISPRVLMAVKKRRVSHR